MNWMLAKDGDRLGALMYRRHYSCTNLRPKKRQFVGPGEKLVLMGFMCNALFVWRKSAYRADGQQGVNCAVFRNESNHLSSDLIREAVVIAHERWPGERLFTMVNPCKVKSSNPGYCFLKAGWRKCGRTKRGLIILEAT